MANEKISLNVITLIAPLVITGAVFYGVGSGHVTEAQAMKIAQEYATDEVKRHAFPLIDGRLIQNDIKNLLYLQKQDAIRDAYIMGIISEQSMEEQLGKLRSECNEEKMSFCG